MRAAVFWTRSSFKVLGNPCSRTLEWCISDVTVTKLNIYFVTLCSVHIFCWLGQCHGLLYTDGLVYVASCVCSLAAVEGLVTGYSLRSSSEKPKHVTSL